MAALPCPSLPVPRLAFTSCSSCTETVSSVWVLSPTAAIQTVCTGPSTLWSPATPSWLGSRWRKPPPATSQIPAGSFQSPTWKMMRKKRWWWSCWCWNPWSFSCLPRSPSPLSAVPEFFPVSVQPVLVSGTAALVLLRQTEPPAPSSAPPGAWKSPAETEFLPWRHIYSFLSARAFWGPVVCTWSLCQRSHCAAPICPMRSPPVLGGSLSGLSPMTWRSLNPTGAVQQ